MEQPRRGIADSAIIDWLTFTFPTKNLNKLSDTPITNDGEAILFISSLLEKFVGFGITKKIKLGGKFRFFRERYTCGTDDVLYSNVLIGHDSEVVCIEITGTGCNAAKEGWEQSIYGFINAMNGHITRCDVARDFFDHEYTPEKAFTDWEKGLFTCRGFDQRGSKLVRIGSMMMKAARPLVLVHVAVQNMLESMTKPNSWVMLIIFGCALKWNIDVKMVG